MIYLAWRSTFVIVVSHQTLGLFGLRGSRLRGHSQLEVAPGGLSLSQGHTTLGGIHVTDLNQAERMSTEGKERFIMNFSFKVWYLCTVFKLSLVVEYTLKKTL